LNDTTTTFVAESSRADRVLGALVLVSIAGLFLFTAQSGNAFTTYLIPIVLIAGWTRFDADLRAIARDPVFRSLAALLLFVGASALWSAGAGWLDVLKAQSRVLFVIAYVAATALLARRHRAFSCWTVSSIALAASVSAVVAAASGHVELGRLIGWGDLDRAVMAGLAWGAASLLAIASTSQVAPPIGPTLSLRRAFGAVAALLTFAAMIASGSRSAWIAWIAGGAMWSALGTKRPRRTMLIALLVATGVAIWIAVDPALSGVLLPRGDSFRPEIWESTFRAVRDGNWLFGAGLLTRHTFLESGHTIDHPHSIYLATLFHGGIVALGLLVVLLVVALVRALRHRADWTARASATLLAFAIPAIAFDGGTLIDKVGYLWLLLWTPIAWLIAVPRDAFKVSPAPPSY
jgi:O-antigen ligase